MRSIEKRERQRQREGMQKNNRRRLEKTEEDRRRPKKTARLNRGKFD
jgi:hypothetical protein